ncbi:MAG: ester cyclase [Deltaproteobacteria bacterium]|nr:ester cyclase [Deltaproteobacteria bacterium]
MSDRKVLVREFVDAVMSEGDVAATDRYLDASFVDHQPFPGHPGTRDGFKAGLAEMRAAFPDLRVNVEDVIEEGDKIALRVVMTGTQTGGFMGAPPSGRTIRVEGIDVVRVCAGKMVEHWGLMDTPTMLEQLGIGAPPPA